jgi:hypothetical protein
VLFRRLLGVDRRNFSSRDDPRSKRCDYEPHKHFHLLYAVARDEPPWAIWRAD